VIFLDVFNDLYGKMKNVIEDKGKIGKWKK